ncbi:MAG: hypothetical protein QM529_05315 [Hydrotalea sp.]|nr:hypothetical protein [Hydrotalea sp.]
MKKITALLSLLAFGLALTTVASAANAKPDQATCDQLKQKDQTALTSADSKVLSDCKKAGM